MADVQKTVESLGCVGDKHGNALGPQSAIDGVDAVVRHLLMLDGHLPGGSGLSWNFIQPEKFGPCIRLPHQGVNFLLVVVVVADRDEYLSLAETQGLFQGRNPQGRRVAMVLFEGECPDLSQCQVCHASFAVGHAVHGLVGHEHERVVAGLSHVDRHGSTTLLNGFLYGVERVLGRTMPVATMCDDHHGGVFLVEELLAQVLGVIVALHGIVDGEVYFGLLCGFLWLIGLALLRGKSDDACAQQSADNHESSHSIPPLFVVFLALLKQPVSDAGEGVGHTPRAVVPATLQMGVADGDGLTAKRLNLLRPRHFRRVEGPGSRVGLGT